MTRPCRRSAASRAARCSSSASARGSARRSSTATAVEPLELGHLPYRKATFEDYVGERGRGRLGKKRWREAVAETVELLSAAIEPDYVVLGGGNAKHIKELPPNTRLGSNENAFLGAFRLWDEAMPSPRPA